jgi:hypothetical protein
MGMPVSAREWPFKLTDVKRLVQAVRDMQLPVTGVRFCPTDGSIHIDTSEPPEKLQEDGRPNSFDAVLGS